MAEEPWRAKKGASFWKERILHGRRRGAVGKPEPEVERVLRKLILGGLNLLCKVGSMSFCKMGLKDQRRGWFKLW